MINVYEYILAGDQACEESAKDSARNIVWQEIETSTQNIKYHRYIDTINGVEIYYDYGADYYFFVDVVKEDKN